MLLMTYAIELKIKRDRTVCTSIEICSIQSDKPHDRKAKRNSVFHILTREDVASMKLAIITCGGAQRFSHKVGAVVSRFKPLECYFHLVQHLYHLV